MNRELQFSASAVNFKCQNPPPLVRWLVKMGVRGPAMVTISAKGRISRDGTLDLRVTTGLPETDVEVLLVLEPLVSVDPQTAPSKAGWPEGFFDRTFASLRDNPIGSGPPPQLEIRQELR